ncbi:NAD(P)H-binding protein [Liquorilactobacillus sicerae]|uniref:NAD(P)H-binding protein n=1 Tax=Liquorilactobacillus sicerae TaxID=1416943 RepID=UPI0024818F30|nr:NAD(P)H-binding protein [Liquorilactobacillus sicerae]
MKYAVTAATGKFGQTAIKTLLKLVDPSQVVAVVRNPQKAQKILPAQVEIRQGDYTQPTQLEAAFAGIERLLFISSLPGGKYPRDRQHLNVVAAAKKAGVKFVAYTSFPHADQATSPLSADHRVTEKALAESGLKTAFLRNNWYLENQADFIKTVLAGQPVYYATGDSQVGWAPEAIYAQAAAKVLVAAKPKNVYEFAGPMHTFAELANAAAEVGGVKADAQAVSKDKYRQILQQQGLQAAADVLLMIQGLIGDGELAHPSKDLEEVLATQLPTLTESIAKVFK